MASTYLDAITTEGTHGVGSLNGLKVKTLARGAVVSTADVDNFTIVELAGFNDDGEQLCKQLSDTKNKGYIIAAPEQRYLNEDISHFYNAVGDHVRLVLQEEGYTRFETSTYSKNTGLTTIKQGNVAHFDATTKKYIVSDATSAHADYTTAGNKYVVVADEDECAGNFNQPTIRLMCQ